MGVLTLKEAYYCLRMFDLKSGVFKKKKFSQYEIINYLEGRRTGFAYDFFRKMLKENCIELIDHKLYVLNEKNLIKFFSESQMVEGMTWESFFKKMGYRLPYVTV